MRLIRAARESMRRREKSAPPRTWTIAVESTPGYGDEARADWVADTLERALSDRDPHVGLEPSGSITIVLDVSAESFDQAVAQAVDDVVSSISDAGGEFPVDYSRLPDESLVRPP
jgi:hypothetical protein